MYGSNGAVPSASAPPAATAPPDAATPPLSKRKEKKAKKLSAKARAAGSTDVMVQHTNDDSVVSKRSAVHQGYLADDYLRHYVKKLSRRSPLINRGYYLRMKVITDLVQRAVDYLCTNRAAGAGDVQVISLGAGYDTLAMRMLHQDPHRDLYRARVHFYDVDFPAVMQSKAALMGAAPRGSFPEDLDMDAARSACPVRSPHYHAVGVDLREAAEVLLPQLQATGPAFSPAHPTVIYAECVMQYMPADDATALVRYIAKTFPDAIFAAYDQLHPEDSFGDVMQSALRQKRSPLLGLQDAPDGAHMLQRARDAGMTAAAFANFFDLSRHVIAREERGRVDALEPFDEAEEWSEMCGHYGITAGATGASSAPFLQALAPVYKTLEELESATPDGASAARRVTEDASEVVEAVILPWPSNRFSFEGWGNGGAYAETTADGADVYVVSFGGFAASTRGHQRVNSVFVHSLRYGELSVVGVPGPAPEDTPPALVFHTFTRVGPYTYLVLGGRTNPTAVSDAAYLLQVRVEDDGGAVSSATAVWRQIKVASACGSPPVPRYRHAAVLIDAASAPAQAHVLVYGGRDSRGTMLGDACIFVVDIAQRTGEWRSLPLHGGAAAQIPAARCSCTLTALSNDRSFVWVTGGLLEGEHATGEVWRLNVSSGACERLEGVWLGRRFSHTVTLVKCHDGAEALLVLGGSGSEPKAGRDAALLVECAEPHRVRHMQLPEGCPCWSRHSCVTVADGVVAVTGGGYTCFSFGTFTAKPMLLQLGAETPELPWTRATPKNKPIAHSPVSGLLPAVRPPVMELLYSPKLFEQVARAASQPVVFRRVDLGPCVDRWRSARYLSEAEKDAVVSVHVAPGVQALDFVRKNFSFRHVRFAELVQQTVEARAHVQQHGSLPEESWYYRSIATHMKSDRANLWRDFKTLGQDFSLPVGAREWVMPRVHQSCLRINAGPLQLWTHYDTFDNVLCQIVGRKRVVFFPPSEFNNLYMSGSSSPVLHIDHPDLAAYPRFIEASRRAIEVVLEPGDMLYFPALWFHHITTLDSDPYSVSVNVFFEHFEKAVYDAHDLYGNKDLPACVEMREQIVAHAKERLEAVRLPTGGDVPPAYTEFALRGVIQDLDKIASEMAQARRAERHLETFCQLP